MGHAEEKTKITGQINDLSEQIVAAKAAKQPKDEWDPILKQMLALKLTYEEAFGESFGGKKEEKAKGSANMEASDKNKEKNAKKAVS
jgi:hypothetical protein